MSSRCHARTCFKGVYVQQQLQLGADWTSRAGSLDILHERWPLINLTTPGTYQVGCRSPEFDRQPWLQPERPFDWDGDHRQYACDGTLSPERFGTVQAERQRGRSLLSRPDVVPDVVGGMAAVRPYGRLVQRRARWTISTSSALTLSGTYTLVMFSNPFRRHSRSTTASRPTVVNTVQN